jgi:hypothetical protein
MYGISISKESILRSSNLESIFYLLSNKSDIVLLSKNLNQEFVDIWKNTNLVFGETLILKNFYSEKEYDIKKEIKDFIQWGRLYEFTKNKIVLNPEILKNSGSLNSKYKLNLFKLENHLCNYACRFVNRIEELLEFGKEFGYPIVVKTDFSFSGSGNLILETEASLIQFKNKFDNIRKYSSHVLVQKWLRRKSDFSYLFNSFNSSLEFLSKTKMNTNSKGNFSGIYLDSEQEDFMEVKEIVEEFLKSYSIPYTGPLSVDGFEFEDGIEKVSEINFRWSMGRVNFELQKKLNKKFLLSVLNKEKWDTKKILPLSNSNSEKFIWGLEQI